MHNAWMHVHTHARAHTHGLVHSLHTRIDYARMSTCQARLQQSFEAKEQACAELEARLRVQQQALAAQHEAPLLTLYP